jgi:hypothetical protein
MRLTTLTAGVCLLGLTAASASAQTAAATTATTAQAPTTTAAAAPAPAEAAPAKSYTVTTGLDFTSAYLFRGIRQHSGGTIAQPYGDVAYTKNGVTFDIGTWNSVHSTAPSGNYYERDYFGSVTFTAGLLKPGLLYTSYTSPADSFATVQELAGTLAIDDSKSRFPLSPKIVLAFELADGQADAGTGKGTYLELGIRPTVKLAPRATLAIPVKTGLGLHNYYEGAAIGVPGESHFGYFDSGLSLSVPLVSGRNGTLEAHGGFDLMFLGDVLKQFNLGDGFKPVTLVGFTYSY